MQSLSGPCTESMGAWQDHSPFSFSQPMAWLPSSNRRWRKLSAEAKPTLPRSSHPSKANFILKNYDPKQRLLFLHKFHFLQSWRDILTLWGETRNERQHPLPCRLQIASLLSTWWSTCRYKTRRHGPGPTGSPMCSTFSAPGSRAGWHSKRNTTTLGSWNIS